MIGPLIPVVDRFQRAVLSWRIKPAPAVPDDEHDADWFRAALDKSFSIYCRIETNKSSGLLHAIEKPEYISCSCATAYLMMPIQEK